MKFRNIVIAAAVALLPLAASAATIVVPAAGTGPGANGSQWESELTLHNAGPRAITVSIAFHQDTNVIGPVTVTLEPRRTVSIDDIARTRFGLSHGNGALVLDVADRDARHLAVTSRVTNVMANGEFGQDIPAVRTTEAAVAGEIAALTGPSSAATTRFNFGVYAVSATTVKWELLRADGTPAGSAEVSYAAGQHAQYNRGTEFLLGAEPRDNDTVHARVISGSAIFYGSAINDTGDPTFVPSVRTRDDILIVFGIDVDEDGTVDIADADGDGVLDAPLEVFTTSGFAEYFRIVAAGEFGEPVSLEIVSSTSGAMLVDNKGTVLASGDVNLRGKSGEIVVRATAPGTTTLLTIPVRFR